MQPDSLGDRTITVFGGTGFLGRHVVAHLLDAGATVRVVARGISATGTSGRAEAWPVDICRDGDVAAALAGADGAVNAVSLYVEGGGLDFAAIHVEGAERIARHLPADAACGLVHISGIGINAASRSRYVRARTEGERAVRAARPNAIVLRPSVLFGPDDSFLQALKKLTRAPLIPLFGTGATRLQPVHVADVAAAATGALARTDIAGRVFELGGAEILTYREIVERVLRATGRRRPCLPVPFPLWHALAALASRLPGAPLTRDQVILMEQYNVAGRDTAGLADLGIEPRRLVA